MATRALDHEGCVWVVTGVRDTPHAFPILLGYPEGVHPRRDGVSSKQVILTPELVDHLERHRRSTFKEMDLPLGSTVLTRLRKMLGHHRYDDAAAWWESRLSDLQSLTLSAFAEKHGVTVGAAEAQRLKLLGKSNRDEGWWRLDPARSLLTSDRPASEIGLELGIPARSVGRLRTLLKREGYFIATDFRERMARAKRGKPIHPKTAAALRRAAKRKKPKAHRQHIAEALRRWHWDKPPKPVRASDRLWTPAEDRLLGQTLDGVVARALGRTAVAVRARRRLLGIPASRHSILARTPRPPKEEPR